jgi:hypothetical protein
MRCPLTADRNAARRCQGHVTLAAILSELEARGRDGSSNRPSISAGQ